MQMASKRALITGIHGFTGRYMAAELRASGYEVFGTGSQPLQAPDYRQADLTDGPGLRALLAELQPDVVLHLAAIAFVGHGAADAFYQVNLIGTRNLLEAIAACGKTPECVLIASSANVYGNVSEGMLGEQTPPAPANDYAVSKLAMEYMARLWCDRLLSSSRVLSITPVLGRQTTSCCPRSFRTSAARLTPSSWAISMSGGTSVMYVQSCGHIVA